LFSSRFIQFFPPWQHVNVSQSYVSYKYYLSAFQCRTASTRRRWFRMTSAGSPTNTTPASTASWSSCCPKHCPPTSQRSSIGALVVLSAISLWFSTKTCSCYSTKTYINSVILTLKLNFTSLRNIYIKMCVVLNEDHF